jgi:hypothetical protein
MSRDYADLQDPYGIRQEYTSQSADTNVEDRSRRKAGGDHDVRGNTLIRPRGIPTQEEADRIKGEV